MAFAPLYTPFELQATSLTHFDQLKGYTTEYSDSRRRYHATRFNQKEDLYLFITPRLPPHSLPASQMDLLVKRPRTVCLPQPLTRVQPLPLLSNSPITRDTLSPSWSKKPYQSPFSHLPLTQPLTRTPPLSPLPPIPFPSYSNTPQSIPPLTFDHRLKMTSPPSPHDDQKPRTTTPTEEDTPPQNSTYQDYRNGFQQ